MSVTNNWPNRLIGDEQFPDDYAGGAWTHEDIPFWPEWLLKHQPWAELCRLTFTPWKHWWKNESLLPSGLLGSVTLLESKRVEVK